MRPIFYSIASGKRAMKQTVVVVGLALLFALGVTLSFTADSYGPAATAETTAPAPPTQVEAPQPVFAAIVKPAEPDVPVAMLDDVPPRTAGSPAATPAEKPVAGAETPARWFVEAGTSPSPRTANALIAPYPFAPTTTVAVASRPAQDIKQDVKAETKTEAKPPEVPDARPARKPQNSHAQRPVRRRAANARSCGSSSRWTDLLRQLNLAQRCRRSAA
jgi:hypothetical protein